MKQIKNKINGIIINGNNINSNSNSVNYSINIPISDIEYAISAFTYINGATQLVDGQFIYGADKHIPNLPDIMNLNYIETSDVGLSGSDIMKNFSASILFLTNALELNLEEWELI